MLTGCQLNRTPATDMAYLRGNKVFVKSMRTSDEVKVISLEGFRSIRPIGCFDFDNDGVDEIAIDAKKSGTSDNLFLVDSAGVIRFSMAAANLTDVLPGDLTGDGLVEVVLHRRVPGELDKLTYIDRNTKSEVFEWRISANALVTPAVIGYQNTWLDRGFYWYDSEKREIQGWSPKYGEQLAFLMYYGHRPVPLFSALKIPR